MAKTLKSQWEFGDLFSQSATPGPASASDAPPAPAPAPVRHVLTVAELTGSVRRLLEEKIGRVWVTGEITNLRLQSSGHAYFSLKDAAAQLSCVLFRNEAKAVSRDLLRDGQKVTLYGEITVYEARGQYQIIVAQMELQGTGSLQIAFERLKQKLQAEGLFAQDRKRSLPHYPQRIGIVTSATGAALRDVIHVFQRRAPNLDLILASCRVQGQGAGDEIACAIRLLNQWNDSAGTDSTRRIDLILVTRGGGSLEDLWAFNEETVARAIFDSKLPVVSGVGHEIDFTIGDFVADIRAATPSVAAELITEGIFASRQFIAEASGRLRRLAENRLEFEREGLFRLRQRLQRSHPRRRLQEQIQKMDDLQASLSRCLKHHVRHFRSGWLNVYQRLLRVKPSQILERRREVVAEAQSQMRDRLRSKLKELQTRVAHAETRLRLLSPTSVLERGYSITADVDSGRIVRNAAEVRAGQRLKTRLQSGEIISTVDERTAE